MKDYLFDVQLKAAFRIPADSEHEARAMLESVLDCASVNVGALPDGSPVIGEASLFDEPELVTEDNI